MFKATAGIILTRDRAFGKICASNHDGHKASLLLVLPTRFRIIVVLFLSAQALHLL